MTRSLNFGNHLQVPHLLFFSQIPPLHLQRLLQFRISILFSTLPHHFCCLPPSPPSGQSLKQDWQSLQCFLLPYNSSVLVPILVASGPHWVPISLSGSLSIKISIHSLCSSICFLLSKNGICSRPRLMTILFHFLPSFFTLIFDNLKDSTGDLTFETLITILTIENLNSDNHSYLTINCDTGQHSQFLRCLQHELDFSGNVATKHPGDLREPDNKLR